MIYSNPIEMQEVMVLSDIDRVKAISDPLRIQILQLLIKQKATVKQVADLLGQSSAKIHYHIKELERKNIINLVETIEKGGILEKYYRATAKYYEIKYEIF